MELEINHVLMLFPPSPPPPYHYAIAPPPPPLHLVGGKNCNWSSTPTFLLSLFFFPFLSSFPFPLPFLLSLYGGKGLPPRSTTCWRKNCNWYPPSFLFFSVPLSLLFLFSFPFLSSLLFFLWEGGGGGPFGPRSFFPFSFFLPLLSFPFLFPFPFSLSLSLSLSLS